MSNQQNKTCKGCHVSQKYEEFLNENGVVLKKCLKCRNKLKITRSKNKKLELDKIICYTDITETIYNFLISLNNTNEFYEGENEKLNMSFYIELSSFLDFILEKDGSSNKENHEIEMAHHIITSISEENINCSASEICHQVRECQINGYESITIQQIYYWWSIESHKIYCRHSDPLLSTKILLEESNLEIIVNSLDSSLPALGFLTTLFDRLIYNKFDAIVIDTTYGTNNLSWELYAIMGVIDGTGFPLSYLLISAGKNRNITEILTYWMQALKERNLRYFPFILTDKDFSEINASKTRLASNKKGVYYSYNPKIAHEECSLIDPNWEIVNNSNSTIFCLLDLRKTVIKLVENHSSRHMLLPKSNGTFIIDANEIWKEFLVQQLYRIQLLQQGRYSVPWRKEFKKEWKQHEKKEIRSNNNYFTDSIKWICACLAYIHSHFFLCKHLINSVEKADAIFFKKVQRNGNYPLISSYEGKFVNVFCLEDSQNHKISIPLIQDSIVEHENDYIIESDEEEDMYEADLTYLHGILDKAKELLENSRNKPKRHLWLKNVCPNFRSLERMNNDIIALENRRTMPKT
ncbi:ATP-dependent DNA helicase PIF1 [Rhizophagus irregularis DAOM 181602=DAOM 197198]|nr:ATP-dependent DNA helicase PIF1 [Rhizophagus irregularis DAOM 181602=DAOM 197198]